MTTTTSTITNIPGYVVGTWAIDPVHSEVGFTVRHMMVSKVRGTFRTVSGTFTTAENPLDSSVEAEIEMASVDTGNPDRDAHVRSGDFFSVDTFPTMTYRSTGIREDGDGYVIDGELTLKGVTRSVPLQLELGGFAPDAFGGTRAGITARGTINRSDFGVDFNMAIEAGGVVIGDKVAIELEIEGVLQ